MDLYDFTVVSGEEALAGLGDVRERAWREAGQPGWCARLGGWLSGAAGCRGPGREGDGDCGLAVLAVTPVGVVVVGWVAAGDAVERDAYMGVVCCRA